MAEVTDALLLAVAAAAAASAAAFAAAASAALRCALASVCTMPPSSLVLVRMDERARGRPLRNLITEQYLPLIIIGDL